MTGWGGMPFIHFMASLFSQHFSILAAYGPIQFRVASGLRYPGASAVIAVSLNISKASKLVKGHTPLLLITLSTNTLLPIVKWHIDILKKKPNNWGGRLQQ
jgi:hypothetical protein